VLGEDNLYLNKIQLYQVRPSKLTPEARYAVAQAKVNARINAYNKASDEYRHQA
jgi:hypothetical protein